MSAVEMRIEQDQAAQPAELMPLSLEDQALLATLTLPREKLDDLRVQYDEVIKELEAIQLVPDNKLALRAVSDLIAWEWFGQPGDELPGTLAILSPAEDSGPVVICKPQPYLGHKRQYIIAETIANSCKSITKKRSEYYISQRDAITQAYKNCLRQGPQYNLLKAFTVEKPITEQQPLTLFWRQVRETQLERSIKQQFGIAPDQSIVDRSPAGLALQGALARLDFETMPGSKIEEQNAFQRVNAWILGKAQQWVRDAARHEQKDETAYGKVLEITIYPTYGGTRGTIGAKTTSGRRLLLDERVAGLSAGLCDSQYGMTPYGVDKSDKNLTFSFLNELYAQDNKDVSLALETALDSEARRIARNITNYLYKHQPIHSELLLRLRRPKGEICTDIPDYANDAYNDVEQAWNTVTIHDIDALKLSMGRTAGHVLKPDAGNSAVRLITTQPRQYSYPLEAAHPDLIIYLEDSANSSLSECEPFIPGYAVIAQDGLRWYFTRSLVDPYKSAAGVKLDQEGLDVLMSQYLDLGLSGLAKALQKRRDVSVSDLEAIIKHEIDYTFDTSLPSSNYFIDAETIPDFSDYVRRKRLQVQCTGASAFLISSLRVALPGSYGRQFVGLILPEEGRISGILHAQSLLNYGDDQYILDATPSAPRRLGLGEIYNQEQQTPRYIRWPLRAKPKSEAFPLHQPQIRPPEAPAQDEKLPEVKLAELVAASIEENMVAAPVRLEQLLQVAFNAPNRNNLYEFVAALNRHDPIRRALESVVRYDGSAQQAEALRATQKYLHDYLTATPETLKRLRITQYDPSLIHSVTAALAMLN